ncbi:hypothetical protein DIPPA_16436 [Diplonema papillatum]|nr:hypothetical protein DIPPA_16436 [Diplonema papillatum]KAJ9456989.1 hypothetical protein DIPPA_16436 [Diplonema papillatum]KAJ9456990.1 hypothetical protein DIPPA_16436 [Diplonema papillatum]
MLKRSAFVLALKHFTTHRQGTDQLVKAPSAAANMIEKKDNAVAAYLKREYQHTATNDEPLAAAVRGLVRRDVRTLQAMGSDVGIRSQTTLISLFTKLRAPKEAAEWFDAVLRARNPPNCHESTLTVGLLAYHRADRLKDFNMLVAALTRKATQPDGETCEARLAELYSTKLLNVVLQAFAQHNPDRAKFLFAAMTERGKVSEVTVLAYLKVCMPDEAEELLREQASQGKLGHREFASLIASCVRRGGVGKATELWKKYEPALGEKPRVAAYNAMVEVCRRFSDPTSLRYWLQKMSDDRVPGDDYTYATAIMACAEMTASPTDAEARLGHALFRNAVLHDHANNIKVCGAAAQLYAKHRDTAGTDVLLAHMAQNNVQKTAILNDYVAEAYSQPSGP